MITSLSGFGMINNLISTAARVSSADFAQAARIISNFVGNSSKTPSASAPVTPTSGSGSNGASAAGDGANGAIASDHRVRISAQPGQEGKVYGGGIIAPLKTTGGLMFPYTPSISMQHDVDYATMQMTHSNTDFMSYSRTPNVQITINGKFTVQNEQEGQYAIAAIHLLRTLTKMYFGQQDTNAGLPPPIMLLSGYGTYMFNKVRVIVKTFSHTFDEHVDMIPIRVGSGTVHLPALFTLTVSLATQPTPAMMRKQFTLDEYRSGALLEKGGWL